MGSIPGSGGSPGDGNGNPLQDSCLGDLTDRGAWWAAIQGVTQSQTILQFASVQSCPTLCNPMDCRAPGLPVHHLGSDSTTVSIRHKSARQVLRGPGLPVWTHIRPWGWAVFQVILSPFSCRPSPIMENAQALSDTAPWGDFGVAGFTSAAPPAPNRPVHLEFREQREE